MTPRKPATRPIQFTRDELKLITYDMRDRAHPTLMTSGYRHISRTQYAMDRAASVLQKIAAALGEEES